MDLPFRVIIPLFLGFSIKSAWAHHDIAEPWVTHFHQHGIFRAFFGGFISTLFFILGAIVFYHYCLRGTSFGKLFPLFPKKPIIPITIPFARAPNYMDRNQPETIVLTASTSPPSVFYSNAHSSDVTQGSTWKEPHAVHIQNTYPGYHAV